MGLSWGILSTARINDKLLAGAAASELADVVAVAAARNVMVCLASWERSFIAV